MALIPLYDTNPLRYIRYPYVTWGLLAANVLIDVRAMLLDVAERGAQNKVPLGVKNDFVRSLERERDPRCIGPRC